MREDENCEVILYPGIDVTQNVSSEFHHQAAANQIASLDFYRQQRENLHQASEGSGEENLTWQLKDPSRGCCMTAVLPGPH